MARLNFSHNVQAYHLGVMNKVRALSRELKTPIGLIVDLQGPRIRLGDLPKQGVKLVKGKKVVLTTGALTENKLPVTFKRMHLDVKPKERVLIADGLINLVVDSVSGRDIHCTVVNGGLVTSHKGINLPDSAVKLSALTEKDKLDVAFAVKNKADFIALSFVSVAKDVLGLRALIASYEKKFKIKRTSPIMVIVKIERKDAIKNFDEILAATDAVMVARGDLGVELPAEDVPLLQKMMIDKCLKAAKPVIVATQMFESMITNPRPTRAEVSDVANAVIDHTDAVMLSGETATGKYPVEAVTMMAKVAEATEASSYDDLVIPLSIDNSSPVSEVISQIAKLLSEQQQVKIIIGATLSGHTGRIVSRYRPEKPTYIACNDERVLRQLCLSWGVNSFKLPICKDYNVLTEKAKQYLKRHKLIKSGEKIIMIAGVKSKSGVKSNIVEFQEA